MLWLVAMCYISAREKWRVCVLPAPHRGMQKRVCGMDGDAAEGATDIAFVAQRNNSLPSGSRLLTLGSLAAVVLAISLGFALSGALLVLPFAGLELLAAGLAFRYMEQRAAVPSERTPENPLIQGTLLGEV